MSPEWLLQNTDEDQLKQLSDQLPTIPLPLLKVLRQRGHSTSEAIEAFLNPGWHQLHDAFLLTDMDKAVGRLFDALHKGEHILLYGDYDADGITAVALLYKFLQFRSRTIDYYLPDRQKEGYGLSEQGVQYAIDKQVKLLITVDCGIQSHDSVAKAQDAGIDVIICDHHLPGEALPRAFAIIDPKRADCEYPYTELSGAGLAFKLAQAMVQAENGDIRQELGPLMDLLAVSIAADIVPMTGENRILTYLGLQRLNRQPCLGIKALLKTANLVSPLQVRDIVYNLAPLLNVAGRLADAGTAVRLLLQHSPLAATQEAESLVYQNGLRRELDRSTAAEAIAMVPEQVPTALVLYQDHWHSGVLGIAAARLAEKFHRPVILLTKHNGLLTGSARSIPGVNLFEALQGAGHLLESFGGHAFAAGLKMQSTHLDAFKEHFLQAVIQQLSTPSPIPILEIAGEIDLSQINNNFINTWRRMAPFGPQHRNPVFVCRKLQLQEPAAILKNDTLSFRLKSENDRVWQITGFRGIHWLETVQQGPFDLAFTLYESFWQNKHRIGLVIKDIQPSS